MSDNPCTLDLIFHFSHTPSAVVTHVCTWGPPFHLNSPPYFIWLLTYHIHPCLSVYIYVCTWGPIFQREHPEHRLVTYEYLWHPLPISNPNIQSQSPIPISCVSFHWNVSKETSKNEWDQRMRFQTEETPFFMNRCLFSYVDIALHIDRCLFSYGDVSFHTSIFM